MQIDRDYHRPDWTLDEVHPRCAELFRWSSGGQSTDLQSLTQVITGLAATPPVRLRVVNASGYEVRGVELGEQLYLKVEMLDETVFGIFGSGLLARSGMGTETVMLIDDRGCPVEPAIFPALEKSGDSKSLVAPFQAFKFASESTVKFQLTVSFCLDVCTPVRCEDEGTKEIHQSFGRRKRSKDLALELQSGDVVTDITMETPLFVVSSGKHPQSSEMSNQRKFTTTSGN
ncbi:ZP domain-containing protein [Trichonephila inaurata madagascariensis]|uniref:ZP domain-containing protein n=1 Tax=Trichonephila inaurata madagascariensis TaxID=2747483 RepID=A0A8X6YRK1_9ARAC|nr:ZP domain-containing protein [Trichonephila inaurata madagascariensis]